MTRKLWPWVTLGVLVVVAMGALVFRSGPSSSPAARADRLEHQLACPVCEGQSVADSNAPESRAIRDDIPKRIAAGQSDQEIRDAYVRTYGDRILLTPGNGGIALVAWILPALAVLLGLCAIGFALRRWSKTPRLHATPEDEAIVAAAREQQEQEPEPR